MDQYLCQNFELPNRLYRVHYPQSNTTFTEEDGLRAGDIIETFGSGRSVEFKQAVENHFKWSHPAPSPFITLFSDLQHAENWGSKTPWLGGGYQGDDWHLLVIDPRACADFLNCFFKLNTLVKELEIAIPLKAQQHILGAFLCLHRIPGNAIISIVSPSEVEQDRDRRRNSLYNEELGFDDHLDGYSGSEREALQENYNTIVEKNIEDNW